MTSTDVLKSKTIGWIGIGRMGHAMAMRLLDAGESTRDGSRTV